MLNAHRITPAQAALTLRFVIVFALIAVGGLVLTGCASDPEIATPPAEEDEVDVQDEAEDTEGTEDTDDAEGTEEETDATTEETEEPEETEATQVTHEGPYVISILNAGGYDGLAAAAQGVLEAAGIAGDDYDVTTDTYLDGYVASTEVYVTGEGDDAADVLAQAEQVAAVLGATVQTFDASQFVDATLMDDVDILVLVGPELAS